MTRPPSTGKRRRGLRSSEVSIWIEADGPTVVVGEERFAEKQRKPRQLCGRRGLPFGVYYETAVGRRNL
jgi:hypothetical protein